MRILEIKFKRNQNFEIYSRIEISEIKFERNWNFENYLRVWDFKKLNYEKMGLWKLNFERNQN